MKVIISRDNVWVGEGNWTEYCEIVNCQAFLGGTQDDSDDVYEKLAHELASLPQMDDMWRGPVIVVTNHGTYSAELVDA